MGIFNLRKAKNIPKNEIKSKTFSISIPDDWENEWEKNVEYDTLMLWKRDSNSTLRITSLIIEPAKKFSANEFINDRQKKHGGVIFQKNGFHVLSFKKETLEGDIPLIQDYWELAKGNRIFVISFTIDKKTENLLSIKKEKEEIKNFIFSITIF